MIYKIDPRTIKIKTGFLIATLGIVYVLFTTGFFCPAIFMCSDLDLYSPQILFRFNLPDL
jgi:hypothetical protein